MTVRLRDLRDCFEGVIPSIIATQDAEGVPNVSYLSQVWMVDDERVALSNQFFSKTAANVAATGGATLILVDGRTGDQFVLQLAFERAEETGPLFTRMSAHLQAISSQHGMGGVMALRSADVYRVIACNPVPPPAVAQMLPPDSHPRVDEPLARAARVAAAIAAVDDAEHMLDQALDGLTSEFAFEHVMVLTPIAGGERLVALGSRGYETAGVGAEVALGQGCIGIAASSLTPVRLCDMSRGRRFAQAVQSQLAAEESRTIPLPGLPAPQSQIAVPMVSQGRLAGVLFAESEARFRFSREEEDALGLISAQLAAGLRLAEMQAAAAGPAPPLRPAPADGPAFAVRFYAYDDSVFIDGAYVIKGVPGRLLFHFLQAYVAAGRTDFSNREIRLDRSLRLPDLKDNLEARLILLRRRLDERVFPVRLERPGRGLIRLAVQGAPTLEVVAEVRAPAN